jgi:hypothetical protein
MEGAGTGLGYNSGSSRHRRGCGEIGRRAGFRFQFPQGSEGSSPFIRTKHSYDGASIAHMTKGDLSKNCGDPQSGPNRHGTHRGHHWQQV